MTRCTLTKLSYVIISTFLSLLRTTTSSTLVRIVTWNTEDNQHMSGSFTDDAIDSVLGLDLITVPKNMPAIYAVGLQQECWMCNKKNLPKLANRFADRINKQNNKIVKGTYEIISVGATRTRNRCEEGCTLGNHGTVVLLLIARKGVIKSHVSFHETNGCAGTAGTDVGGVDTGITATKIKLPDGKTVCFGNLHLDPKETKYKKHCLQNFFKTAEEKADWTQCDAHFLFGDFSTKTGDTRVGAEESGLHFPKSTRFSALKLRDQLTGVLPYGTDWKHNLLIYINSIQTNRYEEGKFNFMPTYYVEPSRKFCDKYFPCYSSSEPLSWPDRIIHTAGKRIKYDAVYDEYGPHFPVFAEYALFGDDAALKIVPSIPVKGVF